MASANGTNGHANGNGNANGHSENVEFTPAPPQKMGKGFSFPEVSLPPKFKTLEEEREYKKGRLACAYRIFADQGLFSGAAGHLTLRDPIETDKFWVLPFGRHFAMICASDLLLIDHHGNVVDGGKPGNRVYNEAAFVIHAAIHNARPDANAVCHSHSPYGKAFSALAKPLPMYTQDACVFYNDLAVYKQHGGVVLDGAESGRIVEALGNKKAIILANHGLLTLGESIESATSWFIHLEAECRVALTLDAACAGNPDNKPQLISDKAAEFTWKAIGSDAAGRFEGLPYFDLMEEQTKGAHKQ